MVGPIDLKNRAFSAKCILIIAILLHFHAATGEKSGTMWGTTHLQSTYKLTLIINQTSLRSSYVQ